MRVSLVFSREAERDVVSAFNWYKLRSILAAEKFLTELDACYARILSNPTAHAIVKGRVRSVRTEGFPYRVYFEHKDGVVQVLRIFHTKRDRNTLFKRMP